MNSSRRPIRKFKTGLSFGVAVSVWKNDKGHSVTITKSYKDKQTGEWKESSGYFREDLAAIALLMPQAIAFIDEQEEHAYQESKGQGNGGAQALPQPSGGRSFDDDIPF